MERKQFVSLVRDLYYQTYDEFDKGLIEDWEQVYFDRLEKALETPTEKVFVDLFYYGDDSLGDVADRLLHTLSQETLLDSTYFEPYDDCLVVVCIVKR